MKGVSPLLLWVMLLQLLSLLPSLLALSNGEVPLRVTLHKEALSDAPSCIQVNTRIALSNTHDVDRIVVRSVETTRETVFVRSNGENAKNVDVPVNSVVPQQLHIPKTSAVGIALQPGEVVDVPLVFFPRFPTDNLRAQEDQLRGETEAPPAVDLPLLKLREPLSQSAKQDLESLIGADRLQRALRAFEEEEQWRQQSVGRRSNRQKGEIPEELEYVVKTNVVIHTSVGTVSVPFTATTTRGNSYNAPDVIQFRNFHDDFPSVTNEATNGVDCYDLHLSNPTNESIVFVEAFTSMPDLVSVNYDKMLWEQPSERDVVIDPVSRLRRNLNDWMKNGPSSPGPHSANTYAVTVCSSKAAQLDKLVAKDTDLGYLHVRLNNETLHISLERKASGSGMKSLANEAGPVFSDDAGTASIQKDNQLKVEHAMDKRDGGLQNSKTNIVNERSDSKLEAYPPNAEFHLIATTRPYSVVPITLRNPSPNPARIMRVTVSVNLSEDTPTLGPQDIGMSIDIHLSPKEQLREPYGPDKNCTKSSLITLPSAFEHDDVKLKGSQSSDDIHLTDREKWILGKSMIIFPHSTVEQGLVLNCSLKTNSTLLIDQMQSGKIDYYGTVVMWASTDTNISYEYWKVQMTMDPFRSSQFVLEIPFKASIVHGRVGFEWYTDDTRKLGVRPQDGTVPKKALSNALDHVLLFPLRSAVGPITGSQNIRRVVIADSSPDGTAKQTYRIINYFPVPLRLVDIAVQDELGQESSDSSKGKRQEKYCRKHLSVSSVEGTVDSDVGKLTLTHTKPDLPKCTDSLNILQRQVDPVIPRTCHLSAKSLPFDAGLRSVPVIVFSGLLTASLDEEEALPVRNLHKFQCEIVDQNKKFEGEKLNNLHFLFSSDLMKWIRASASGRALQGILEDFYYEDAGSVVKKRKNWSSWGKSSSTDETNRMNTNAFAHFFLDNALHSASDRGITVNPIFVDLGAIGHGEVKEIPVHVRNHNPIPVNMNLAVAAVEGMSIEIDHDATEGRRTKGLLSYIHNSENERNWITDENHLERSRSSRGRHADPVDGLRQFLLASEEAQEFFSILSDHRAVTKSEYAVKRDPVLAQFYKRKSIITFQDPRRTQQLRHNPPQFQTNETTACMRKCHEKGISCLLKCSGVSKTERPSLGPLLLAADLSIIRMLHGGKPAGGEEENSKSGRRMESVQVPPGGLVRLKLRVRAPPKEMLLADVTQFVSTGVLLSTDRGHSMPLIVSYEALLGQLRLSKENSSTKNDTKSQITRIEQKMPSPTDNVLDIPVGLFQRRKNGAVRRPAGAAYENPSAAPSGFQATKFEAENVTGIVNKGTPLYVTSTFSNAVTVKEVESCNEWFTVQHQDGCRAVYDEMSGVRCAEESELGETRELSGDEEIRQVHEHPVTHVLNSQKALVGILHSSVSCLPPLPKSENEQTTYNDLPRFPSFYHCALQWLESRATIQPFGCGIDPSGNSAEKERTADYTEEAVGRAVSSLHDIVAILSLKYNGWNNFHRHLRRHDNRDAVHNPMPEEGNEVSFLPQHDAIPLSLSKPSVAPGAGFLSTDILDLFAEGIDAWTTITELGLHTLSSNLRAIIDYSYSQPSSTVKGDTVVNGGAASSASTLHNASTQNLSIAISNLVVQSYLDTPSLFSSSETNIFEKPSRRRADDRYSLPALNFPPTAISEISMLRVPIKNPTSVPIRVRLSAASSEAPLSLEVLHEYEVTERVGNVWDDAVRARFAKSFDAIYVQNDIHGSDGMMDLKDQWWEDGGGYFLLDGYGNSLQSFHNITIKSSGGAQVCMHQPSLHATNAFTVGCGARCGIREEGHNKMGMMGVGGMRRGFAPLGASSAQGSNLHSSPFGSGNEDKGIFSKGTPSAFGIPNSGLAELVIPPFGEASIGPVYFRPPNRLGDIEGRERRCSTASVPNKDSSVFTAVLFLENSLTGLERIMLRGEALWEHVAFLDGQEEVDDKQVQPGDIEFRYGRAALMFNEESQKRRRLRKTLTISNDGNVAVAFDKVYLSTTRSPAFVVRDGKKNDFLKERHAVEDIHEPIGRCSIDGFRLVGCFDEQGIREPSVPKESNLAHGFELLPGQSKTIQIEFRDICTYNSFYAKLVLEHREDDRADRVNRVNRGVRSHKWQTTRRSEELLIGYNFPENAIRSCHSMGSKQGSSALRRPLVWPSSAVWSLFCAGIAFILWVLMMYLMLPGLGRSVVGSRGRKETSEVFGLLLEGRRIIEIVGGSLKFNDITIESQGSRSFVPNNWSAAFRCLSRVDHTAQELQMLGKEQIRHLVLDRYKSVGVLPPHCLSGTGGFTRNRLGNGLRRKDGNNSERSVTLSDAMFGDVNRERGRASLSSTASALPCGLGWRAAASSGILSVPSFSYDSATCEKLASTSRVGKVIESRLSALGSSEELAPNVEAVPVRKSQKLASMPPDESLAPDDAPPLVSTDDSATASERGRTVASVSGANVARARSVRKDDSPQTLKKDSTVVFQVTSKRSQRSAKAEQVTNAKDAGNRSGTRGASTHESAQVQNHMGARSKVGGKKVPIVRPPDSAYAIPALRSKTTRKSGSTRDSPQAYLQAMHPPEEKCTSRPRNPSSEVSNGKSMANLKKALPQSVKRQSQVRRGGALPLDQKKTKASSSVLSVRQTDVSQRGRKAEKRAVRSSALPNPSSNEGANDDASVSSTRSIRSVDSLSHLSDASPEPNPRVKGFIRPPPGLAPPPGFATGSIGNVSPTHAKSSVASSTGDVMKFGNSRLFTSYANESTLSPSLSKSASGDLGTPSRTERQLSSHDAGGPKLMPSLWGRDESSLLRSTSAPSHGTILPIKDPVLSRGAEWDKDLMDSAPVSSLGGPQISSKDAVGSSPVLSLGSKHAIGDGSQDVARKIPVAPVSSLGGTPIPADRAVSGPDLLLSTTAIEDVAVGSNATSSSLFAPISGHKPLFGPGGGFNVVNFLDDILDDSQHIEEDTNEDDLNDDGARLFNRGDAGKRSGTFPPPPKLSADPWASGGWGKAEASSSSSQVSTMGEETTTSDGLKRDFLLGSTRTGDGESSLNSSFPLLTPDNIFAAMSEEDRAGVNAESGTSFYARLNADSQDS